MLYRSLRLNLRSARGGLRRIDPRAPRPATPAASAACSNLRRFKYTDSEVISDGRIRAELPGGDD